ncbi:helix-turn-helix domain-containing protein [Microbacterium gubbeenense]|uniref:helix-turn-helix domain-containing protein n=1 Tax=Microbacterium gubbeenense TaxID=159896 RepID=UPI003F9A7B52
MQSTPVTTLEAATLLGVDRSSITRHVQSGRLTPLMKLTGRTGAYLFDRAEIEPLAAPEANS